MGARASRVLPTICTHRCSVASDASHSASGSGGQTLVLIPGTRSWVRRRFHEQLVDVAPSPVLAALEAANHWMVCLMVMLRRVRVRRVVAATDMAAGETEPQMDPAAAGLQTFFTALRRFR